MDLIRWLEAPGRALSKGAHEAGVGVIVGSSALNLAAMIRLSALLVRTRSRRARDADPRGSAGLGVTATGISQLAGLA